MSTPLVFFALSILTRNLDRERLPRKRLCCLTDYIKISSCHECSSMYFPISWRLLGSGALQSSSVMLYI
jgi:hypothetical protein